MFIGFPPGFLSTIHFTFVGYTLVTAALGYVPFVIEAWDGAVTTHTPGMSEFMIEHGGQC